MTVDLGYDRFDTDGEDITRVFVRGVTTSSYARAPKLGTGVFEILSAHVYPPATLTYAMPADIRFNWTDGVQSYWRVLKSGYVGAQQSVTLNNQIVVGPGTLASWQEYPVDFPVSFEVTYRRLVSQKKGLFG